MDNIILIIILSLASALLTYFITKRVMSKKVSEYNSLSDAISNSKAKLTEIDHETKELQALKENEDQLKKSITSKSNNLETINSHLGATQLLVEKSENSLQELMERIDLYSRLDEFSSFGHFETPQYLYDASASYSEAIKEIRADQKDMIKDKIAITYPSTTVISDDPAYNKKILDAQIKLMLSAFNIECDFLIGKITPSSYSRTLERIEKLANSLEKLSATYECGFNIDYIELKLEECKLQYQYSLKKQEEAAEQKLIKEQIREEQRAIKEYERAIAEAEKEELMYRKLLEKAREELDNADDESKSLMEQRIQELQLQLQEAESKEERAKSMAEQTRKGHVYVISNIGSFGEDVYKIGLTRRLEPMDRVKELGDASVPFSFDVHAMIYTDDAPALETALHKEFHYHRVNAVNHRKEFFNIDLESIKEAVLSIAGIDADFKLTALAEDYYESLRLQEAS